MHGDVPYSMYSWREPAMVARYVHALTSPTFLRAVALAGAVGWAIAFGVNFATQTSLVDRHGAPIGGDFISLYTAGNLVIEGRADVLYDFAVQQETQGRIVGVDDYRALCSFVNPPAVAVAFAPFALLPYRIAYVVYTGLMLGAFLLAFRVLRPHMPALRDNWGTVVGLSFLFYPFAITITGGQNTALTFLLMAAIYVYLRRGSDGLAGLMLGLMFYKPQFALLLALLLLLRGKFRVLATAAAVALAYYFAGAALCGVWWPLEMTEALAVYWPLEDSFNGMNSISLVGFCEHVLPAAYFKPIGAALCLTVVTAVAYAWRYAKPTENAFAPLWGAAVCATILVSPHTQWYDGGLTLLAILLTLNYLLESRRQISVSTRLALLAGFCVAPCFGLAETIGFQPIILLPALALVWTLEQSMSPALAVAATPVSS